MSSSFKSESVGEVIGIIRSSIDQSCAGLLISSNKCRRIWDCVLFACFVADSLSALPLQEMLRTGRKLSSHVKLTQAFEQPTHTREYWACTKKISVHGNDEDPCSVTKKDHWSSLGSRLLSSQPTNKHAHSR